MNVSATERILILVGGLFATYRYLTGKWPVGLEIEQVDE